jgi:DNA-binding transcriptional ArsR family regulator
MAWDHDIAQVGALLAEPARCRMLTALADGRALPVSELAREAHVATSTASGHLRKLADAGWVDVEPQGRHRYYRLVDDDAAELLELATRLAPPLPVTSLAGDLERRRLRRARTCYRHLAGRLGVELLAGLLRVGWVDGHDGSFRHGNDRLSSPGRDVAYRVTDAGAAGLGELGIDAAPGEGIRHCVDWSEQCHHLAGALGARLADRLFTLGWIERQPTGRGLTITELGAPALATRLHIDLTRLDPA